MANQIGAETFDTMKGSPSTPAELPEALPAAVGENHTRWRKNGVRGNDAQIVTMKLAADATAAQAQLDIYRAMQAEAEDIEDAHNTTFLNCMIIRVTGRTFPVIEGGASKYMVVARWIVRQGQPD